jgi:hypothetical protein
MTDSKTPRKWRKLIYTFVGVLAFVCSCSLFGPLYIAEIWAKLLVPPPYPNSRLSTQGQGGGMDVTCQGSTYESADDIHQVLDYMERYLPGFKANLEAGTLSYYNSFEDNRPLARRLASGNKLFPFPPSVQVWLETLKIDGTGTKIRIAACWAAP